MFDFSAVFPSEPRDKLFAALELLGFLDLPLWVVRALYTDSTCDMRVDGTSVSGWVRRGCPLPPLLCIVAADGLLRRLAATVPSSVPRVCADGTAVVVDELLWDTHRL